MSMRVDTVTPVESSRKRVVRRTSQRTVRHTPYLRTPHTRNLRATTRLERTPPNRKSGSISRRVNAPEPELLSKTWGLYRVSPLNNFSHDAAALKHLQRQLAAHVKVETKKGIGIGLFEEETANLACIETFEGLKINAGDPQAIRILLQQRDQRGSEAKTVLTAILCSVGVSDDYVQKYIQDGFTSLPLMLVKGSATLTKHLHNWMKRTFDCCVSPLVLSPTSFFWMLSMWSGYLPERSKSKRVELQYSVPKIVPEMSTITLSIDAQQCKKLWECCRLSQEVTDFTEKEVVLFTKSIEHHFYHHFKIHLENMKLSRIGTAIAYIGHEGKLKMFSWSHVKQVLGHLTEHATELYGFH